MYQNLDASIIENSCGPPNSALGKLLSGKTSLLSILVLCFFSIQVLRFLSSLLAKQTSANYFQVLF